jgi:quinol monooxygenase YgiN
VTNQQERKAAVDDEPITVVATFKIKAGREADFEAAAREHIPHCVAEPGLLRFWVYRTTDEPSRFLFYEDWADRASFDASMVADWRGPYMAATQHLWDEPRVVRVYRRLSVAWDPLGPDGQPQSLASR